MTERNLAQNYRFVIFGLNFIFFCTINAEYKQYKTYNICRWSKVQKGIQKKVKLTFLNLSPWI